MSNSKSYLAFDLGASSGRAILGTLKDKVLEWVEIHRFETPIVEKGDHLYWDTASLWNELRHGLRIALQTAAELRSLSVDSWAVDYVRLDDTGEAVGLPHCYRDARTDGLLKLAQLVMPADEIYRHTGIQFLPFNTLYQVMADQRDHAETDRATNHLTIADYFNYRFGGRPIIELSMASTTQMVDVQTLDWSDAIFGAFGIPRGTWPEIVKSGSVIGAVSYASSVAVVASCSHDTGCAVAAAPGGGADDGWAYISCGTWSLMGVERIEPLLTEEARAKGFTHEIGLHNTIRFLKNLTGLWALQECVREWPTENIDYGTLEQEARAANYEETIDLEDPRFIARGNMEQRIRDFCVETGVTVPVDRGQLVRLILSSIAASYRQCLTDLEEVTGRRFETIHLVGGGIQNRLLCQLTADRCGRQVVAGPAEATALGNLLIQAEALGDLPDGCSVRDIITNSCELKTYLPQL